MAASIFLKDCPECAAANPAEAQRCVCGYRFDSGHADTTVDGLELIAQEERLYRDYLAARVQQAAKELEHARAVAKAFPADKVKAAELLLAEQRYNAARAELDAQSLRAQAVAARAKSARNGSPGKRAAAPVLDVSQASKPEKPKNAAATLRATVADPDRPAVPKPAAEAAPPPAQPGPALGAKPVRKTDPGPSTPPAAKSDPAPSPMADTDRPASAQAPACRQKIPAPKPAGQPSVHAAKPARPKAAKPVQAHPDPSAMKPPAAKRPATARPVSETLVAPPVAPAVGSPTPSPVFRAQQSARAQTALVAFQQNATKDCPNCTASVPLKAARCRCGFEFPDGLSQIPPLALSAEERNAILQALSGLDLQR